MHVKSVARRANLLSSLTHWNWVKYSSVPPTKKGVPPGKILAKAFAVLSLEFKLPFVAGVAVVAFMASLR